MIESQKLSVYFIHVQIDRRFITAFTASAVPLSFTMRRACYTTLKHQKSNVEKDVVHES